MASACSSAIADLCEVGIDRAAPQIERVALMFTEGDFTRTSEAGSRQSKEDIGWITNTRVWDIWRENAPRPFPGLPLCIQDTEESTLSWPRLAVEEFQRSATAMNGLPVATAYVSYRGMKAEHKWISPAAAVPFIVCQLLQHGLKKGRLDLQAAVLQADQETRNALRDMLGLGRAASRSLETSGETTKQPRGGPLDISLDETVLVKLFGWAFAQIQPTTNVLSVLHLVDVADTGLQRLANSLTGADGRWPTRSDGNNMGFFRCLITAPEPPATTFVHVKLMLFMTRQTEMEGRRRYISQLRNQIC